MKLAAKNVKNKCVEPVFCGNSIKINGYKLLDFQKYPQNKVKLRSK
jgi:hypothetical protein